MQQLQVFNTKTKKYTPVLPHAGRTVLVYSCGPTLYKEVHIGNMRAYVFADTLNRALRRCGRAVRHVINFTDVGHLTDDADAGEDKIEREAEKEHVRAEDIVRKIGDLFLSDLKKLHISPSRYVFPKATDYINEQIAVIKQLERKKLTYDIDDGIYFDTTRYSAYGALGLPTGDKSNEYARIQQVQGKKHPHDFALWKRTPPGVTRQQEWDSPWGRGFPGWHIECSAMAMKLLAETITIHTGGIDHITVHHNNEIAQSEAVTGKTFAHIWMHAAFLTVQDEKLSKSLNNTYTVSDLEQRGYHPLALRYLFLQSSYRTPLSFSFAALDAAQTALNRLCSEYAKLPHSLFSRLFSRRKSERHVRAIDEAIADDLNTAKVLATVWDVIRDTSLPPAVRRNTVAYADMLLGVLHTLPDSRNEASIPEHIEELIAKRNKARAARDYDTADELRDRITGLGYEVSDTDNGGSAVRRRRDKI